MITLKEKKKQIRVNERNRLTKVKRLRNETAELRLLTV